MAKKMKAGDRLPSVLMVWREQDGPDSYLLTAERAEDVVDDVEVVGLYVLRSHGHIDHVYRLDEES